MSSWGNLRFSNNAEIALYETVSYALAMSSLTTVVGRPHSRLRSSTCRKIRCTSAH